MTERGNDLALVEAALFLSSQPMTRRALAKLLGDVRLAYVDRLLEDLAATYEDNARGIQVHVEDGRALLRVKSEYVDRVAHIAPQQDVPRPVLRTLAVIAYNHPMTQADLVRVRGNKAYGHVQELIERGLIQPEPEGRTLLLKITPEFLRHFGLKTIEEFRFHAGSPELEIVPEASPPEGEPEASEAGAGEDEAEDALDSDDPDEMPARSASSFDAAPVGHGEVGHEVGESDALEDPDAIGMPEAAEGAPDDGAEHLEADDESNDDADDEPEDEGGK